MRKTALLLLTVVTLLFMAGCGSQSSPSNMNNTNTGSANVPVGLSVTDTPPAGVTVLFFQLSLTGATMTSSSGSTVSLLSSTNPVPINVAQLQTDVAFLGTASVPAGTYNSMNLTFSSPQLTIFNASDNAISAACAVGKVCQLTPTMSGGALSFSAAPFPVTLTASTPLNLKLDIHLNTVIQSDLGLNLAAANGVSVDAVRPAQSGGPIAKIGKLEGTVQSMGTNQFTLQGLGGRNFTINTDSSTTYSGFPSSACPAQGFSCLANGQAVQVTVTLQADGTLLANAVNFVQLPTQQTVQGNIIGLYTSNGNTIMDLMVQFQPMATNTAVLPVGRHASVTVPSTGVTYAVNSKGFALPSGLTFTSASNLQVGQQVLVVVNGTLPITTATNSGTSNSGTGTSGSGASAMGTSGTANTEIGGPVGPPDVLFTASSITLEPSQVTGTVAGVNASALTFTLATLPIFFVPPSATAGAAPNYLSPFIITVDTTSATTFTDFATNSISGLATNQVVSVHGWVFGTPSGATTVTLAADTVMQRPGPTPLF